MCIRDSVIPDASCTRSCSGRKAGNEGLLLHPRTCLQRAGDIMQVSHLVALVGGKSHNPVSAGGHPTVFLLYTSRCVEETAVWYRLPRIKLSVLDFASAGAMLSKKSLGHWTGSGSFFLGFFLLAMYMLLSVEIVNYLRRQIQMCIRDRFERAMVVAFPFPTIFGCELPTSGG